MEVCTLSKQWDSTSPQNYKVTALWHADPLLGNDRKISNYTKAVASNGSANKHVFTATVALQQRNGVFCVACAETL
jgi:hypothetical protein